MAEFVEEKRAEPEALAQRPGRLYMRKWQVLIYKKAFKDEAKKERDPENDIEMDVSHLRCVFRVSQASQTHASVCQLTVFNMNIETEKAVIEEGLQIRIDGGYQEGQYGTIFEGDIAQVIRNRENGVDYKLEILALCGSTMFDWNFSRCSVAAGSKPREVAEAVAKSARQPIEVGEVSENLSEQTLPRGKVIFGQPSKYLRDLTIGNDAYYWSEEEKLVIKKVADEIPEGQVLALSPGDPNKGVSATGLVGTPQYGDDGIRIKMLLDSRVKPLSMVKIDNEIIRRQLIRLSGDGKPSNQTPQQGQFDEDGEYQVFSVTHSGDTHGDEWFTDVVGIGRHGRRGKLISVAGANGTER